MRIFSVGFLVVFMFASSAFASGPDPSLILKGDQVFVQAKGQSTALPKDMVLFLGLVDQSSASQPDRALPGRQGAGPCLSMGPGPAWRVRVK